MREILKKIQKYKNATEKDKIEMILSGFIDVGSTGHLGGCISSLQFDELSDTIIEFYENDK